MDRWADAEIHFDKAMTLNPKAFWVLQAYGSLEVRSKRVEQGVAHLLEAEQINPQHSPTLVEVARLKEMEGDAVSAEDYYRRAVDADRNNSYAYYRFARFLYREGATKEAYEMAKAALATDPTNEGNKKLVKELRDKISELTQT